MAARQIIALMVEQAASPKAREFIDGGVAARPLQPLSPRSFGFHQSGGLAQDLAMVGAALPAQQRQQSEDTGIGGRAVVSSHSTNFRFDPRRPESRRTEVDATLSQSIQKNGAAGTGLSTTDQRNIVQGLTEFTGSVSTGTLRGVIVLETGFDPATKEAWVVSGVSDKTMAAAGAARDMMANPDAKNALTRSQNGDASGSEPKSAAQIRKSGSDF